MIILTTLAVYGLTLLIKSLFSMSAQTYDTMLRIIGAVCFVVCILMLLYRIIREKKKIFPKRIGSADIGTVIAPGHDNIILRLNKKE